MENVRKRWLGRSAVGLGAAMALVVFTAGPASADLPNSIDLEGELVDGSIWINDVQFPLGEEDPADRCTPGEASTITATAGAIVSDVAPVTDVIVDFSTTEVADVLGQPVCAEILVTNNPGGTQTGAPTAEMGTVVIDDPAPVLDVRFDGPFVPADCRIEGIDLDPDTGTADDDLDGPISHAGPGNPWDLTLQQGDHVVGTNTGPTVPGTTDCGIAEGPIESALGSVPTEDVGATLVFELG